MENWFSSEDAAAAAAHTHFQPPALNVDDSPFLLPQFTPPEASSYSSSFPSPWSMPIEGFMDARAPSSSRSHSEAEKRRRDRINAQLATLRKHIPKSEKVPSLPLLNLSQNLNSIAKFSVSRFLGLFLIFRGIEITDHYWINFEHSFAIYINPNNGCLIRLNHLGFKVYVMLFLFPSSKFHVPCSMFQQQLKFKVVQ